jgi:hypothetical protein
VTNRPAGAHYVDCRWPEHHLTVELDSYRYHRSRYSWGAGPSPGTRGLCARRRLSPLHVGRCVRASGADARGGARAPTGGSVSGGQRPRRRTRRSPQDPATDVGHLPGISRALIHGGAADKLSALPYARAGARRWCRACAGPRSPTPGRPL